MLTLLKSLFVTDVTPAARPVVRRTRLGGEGIALETREVPTIAPQAQIAAVQVTPSNTVAALAAVPVNQANADTAVNDARTILTSIGYAKVPEAVQARTTINAGLSAVPIEKVQYDAARQELQSILNAFGTQNAAIQSSNPFLVPDHILAQQRTTVANLTTRLNAEAGELKAATTSLRTAVLGVHGYSPAAATNPLAVRVATQVQLGSIDLTKGGTTWQVADQLVTAGVVRYRQIMAQLAPLEMQRLSFLNSPFLGLPALAIAGQMSQLRQQADQLGSQLVLVQQAMTRQYEAMSGLQSAIERAKDTRTATTSTELQRRETDIIVWRAKLTTATANLQSSRAILNTLIA